MRKPHHLLGRPAGRDARRKFQVGDIARIGGDYQPLPTAYHWLRIGQLVKVVRVEPQGKGRHTIYWFTARRGRPPVFLESFHLRLLEAPYRRRQHRREPANDIQGALA